MSAERGDQGVTVTLREIYRQLVQLTGEVRSMSALAEHTVRELEDHETRIRGIERWRYALPASVIVGVLSAVAAILEAVWH